MGLIIPGSVRSEHGALHNNLSKIINSGGKVGKAAGEVAKALHHHFIKEEKYAMPQLGVLQKLASGNKITNKDQIIRLSEKLNKELPEMLKEHKFIVKKLDILEKIAKRESNKEAVSFVKNLKLHAASEEEVLYPASVLVGKYLKAT